MAISARVSIDKPIVGGIVVISLRWSLQSTLAGGLEKLVDPDLIKLVLRDPLAGLLQYDTTTTVPLVIKDGVGLYRFLPPPPFVVGSYEGSWIGSGLNAGKVDFDFTMEAGRIAAPVS